MDTMKLGFLGLSMTQKKARMIRFWSKPEHHPFFVILKISRYWKNKRRRPGFEPATYS